MSLGKTSVKLKKDYIMNPIKIYDQEDNRTVGIFQDEKTKVFTAMSYSASKDFKTLKAADKWIQKYL